MDIDGQNSTQEPAQFSLDPDTFKKIHPAEYHRRFLSQQVRPDGRALRKFRKVEINVGSITTANGSATVRLGHTTVVCGIKAEVAEPRPATPREGYLVPNVDFPALCSPQFRSGPPGELTQTISEYIRQVVDKSNIINLEDLGISPGNAAWVLYADIVCLNYEGNALDAALMALIAALKNVRLPKATFYDTESTVRATEEKSIPLKLNLMPIASTFGIFDGQYVISDPTDEEESLLSSQMSVILDENGVRCGMLKAGGMAMAKQTMDDCIRAARERNLDVLKVLQQLEQ
ncbi:Exosome complex component RRP43 [Borealophlyctis nickersoniae]|nr:Exosome complex component RRP43 [Borealophlyctis nickersoniae]